MAFTCDDCGAKMNYDNYQITSAGKEKYYNCTECSSVGCAITDRETGDVKELKGMTRQER